MGTDKEKGKKFIELVNPVDGETEWIDVCEFPEGYKDLEVTNGCSWCREKSWLQENYIVEKKYNGRKLTHIKLKGLKNK